jgi:hypothetical protein
MQYSDSDSEWRRVWLEEYMWLWKMWIGANPVPIQSLVLKLRDLMVGPVSDGASRVDTLTP